MDPNRAPGEPAMHLCHYPNCGKVYKKTSHLRAHLRWHIGDQPYLCSWPGEKTIKFLAAQDVSVSLNKSLKFEVMTYFLVLQGVPENLHVRMSCTGTLEYTPGRGNTSVIIVGKVSLARIT